MKHGGIAIEVCTLRQSKHCHNIENPHFVRWLSLLETSLASSGISWPLFTTPEGKTQLWGNWSNWSKSPGRTRCTRAPSYPKYIKIQQTSADYREIVPSHSSTLWKFNITIYLLQYNIIIIAMDNHESGAGSTTPSHVSWENSLFLWPCSKANR